MEYVAQENEKAISGAIKIDENEIRTHLDGLVVIVPNFVKHICNFQRR